MTCLTVMRHRTTTKNKQDKTILKKLGMLVAALLTIPPASAYDFCVDGVYYNILSEKERTVEVARSKNYSGAVTIPEKVTRHSTTYSVASIGHEAFRYCYGLTSVSIGNSVASIGDKVIFACHGLVSATIGNSVSSIGGSAFSYCSGLRSVNIPNSVTSIGDRALFACHGLVSATIGNAVVSIGPFAFYGCSGLRSVVIPNSVISIRKQCLLQLLQSDFGDNRQLCRLNRLFCLLQLFRPHLGLLSCGNSPYLRQKII